MKKIELSESEKEPIRFVEINGVKLQYNGVSWDSLENALIFYSPDKWWYLGSTTNPPTIDGVVQKQNIYTHYFKKIPIQK